MKLKSLILTCLFSSLGCSQVSAIPINLNGMYGYQNKVGGGNRQEWLNDFDLYLNEYIINWTVRSSRKINEFTRVSAPNAHQLSSGLTITERLSMQGF